MDSIYISVVESLIFAADDPISANEIITAINAIDGSDIEIAEDEIDTTVDSLNERYSNNGNAFTILKIANGYVFGTKPDHAKYVGYLSTEKSKRRLSQAALETLAIIAYKQPLTKPELESIRGVNSDYTINTLLEKNLITIQGRTETVGRPLLYVTTEEFLKYFGLRNIGDLPKPREIEEIMKDEDFQEQKRRIMMSGIEETIENEEGLEPEGKMDSEQEIEDESTTE
ncbi:MAG: SMC-Scp complex subunit ScpB [Melioribacteraceae bacterium]|nr:SMC-Scp complex subunit ScpB [Melioribacteraceae bacterium]